MNNIRKFKEFVTETKYYGRHEEPTMVKCECGWVGKRSGTLHLYQPDYEGMDVEPIDKCPKCKSEFIKNVDVNESLSDIPENILDHWLYHYDLWCGENGQKPEFDDVEEIIENPSAINHVYYHANIYAQKHGFRLDGDEYMEDDFLEESLNEKYTDEPNLNFDIKYGLIVLNRKDIEEGIYEILHFVGYEEEPTDKDIELLKDELKEDKSLGLSGLGENLIIIHASDETVEEYKSYVLPKLFEGKVEDVEHTGHGIKYRNELFPGMNQPKKYEGKGKHKYRVLAREGDRVKVVNFGKRYDSKKESITKLSKKYWEHYWK